MRFAPRCIEALVRSSREAAPREACGLLAGGLDGTEVVVLDVPAARNVAARPEREFSLDPGEVVALHDAAARTGARIVGTWHSHPCGAAEPSRADVGHAWPRHVLVIVAGEAVRAFAVEGERWRELTVDRSDVPQVHARGGRPNGA